MEQLETNTIKLKEFYIFNYTIESADIDKIRRRLSREKIVPKDCSSSCDESDKEGTGAGASKSGKEPAAATAAVWSFSEDEHELAKILYYFPPGADTNTKLKKVGMCEAIIKFAENFHTRPSCDSVNTQKARYVFLEPEPHYWFVIVLTVPSCIKVTPEGLEMIEYQSDSIQDSVYQALLNQIYNKFVFLHDTLEQFVSRYGLGQLRIKLGRFMDSTVPRIDVNNCGVNEVFQGLQFQPLDRQLFLDFQSFNNCLMLEYPSVSKVLFYQSDKLVWCGIAQTDVQVFNDYFLLDILPKIKDSRTGFVFKKQSHISLCKDSTMEVGASKCSSNEETDEPPAAKEREHFHMLIYKAMHSFLTILIHDSIPLSEELVSDLDTYVNVNLIPLAKTLTQVPAVTDFTGPSNVKFIYFNNLNLAEKSTLTWPSTGTEQDAYKLLADLRLDLKELCGGNGEITVKLLSECWVVAKASNDREFYAIFNNKGSNLLEIEDELKKLTDANLSNIFFQG